MQEDKMILVSFEINKRKYINVDISQKEVRKKLESEGVNVLSIMKSEIKKLFNALTDKYFYEIAKERGDYLNMGEIYVDASQNDPDAQYLLKLYDAVWDAEEKAEDEIIQLTDQEKLLEILRDIPAYLMPKLEAAKSQLDSSTTSSSTASTSTGA